MAEIKDLHRCNYFPFEDVSPVAVGWLSASSTFKKGPVDRAFFDKLCSLSFRPWQPVISPGMHYCELCQYDAPAFSDNMFIPYKGSIYVAPVAIVHYISCHWYLPPSLFIEAVMACPEMQSMEYKRALLANGGRGLVERG